MEHVSLSETDPTEAIDGVELAVLAGGDRMNVQHFAFEPDARVPEHSHPHEQTGFVFEGTLTFLVDGEEIEVGAGGSYAIPGDELHAAENRTDAPVRGVDIFSPPREQAPWEE